MAFFWDRPRKAVPWLLALTLVLAVSAALLPAGAFRSVLVIAALVAAFASAAILVRRFVADG